jgi:hypothetical protein
MKASSINVWLRLSAALALAVALLLPASTARAEETTYDLNRDWSDNENPNGAWSYCQSNSPISVFQKFWWGHSGWGYLSIGDGCIIKGSYFAGLTDPWGNVIAPAFDWQPGDVMLHALSRPYNGETNFVNVKWTSPGDGFIDITGRAWDGEIFADRDVAWALIVAGQTVAQRKSTIGIHRGDPAAQFRSNLLEGQSLRNIRVRKGDVVEFRVVTATYYGHFVGVNETITFFR